MTMKGMHSELEELLSSLKSYILLLVEDDDSDEAAMMIDRRRSPCLAGSWLFAFATRIKALTLLLQKALQTIMKRHRKGKKVACSFMKARNF